MEMTVICPECGERALPGSPVRQLMGVEKSRLRYRHKDGEPLCPVMTSKGYQPALPIRKEL